MSTPYPPQHPRKLERSRSNRVLGGVCGGLANYLNMDPTLVRILTVLISLFTGVPIVLYLIALFVIPEEGTQADPPAYPPVAPPQYGQSPYGGYGNAATTYPNPVPQAAPQPATDPVWGASGAPWEQPPAAAASPVSSFGAEPEPPAPAPAPAPTESEPPAPTEAQPGEPDQEHREDKPPA